MRRRQRPAATCPPEDRNRTTAELEHQDSRGFGSGSGPAPPVLMAAICPTRPRRTSSRTRIERGATKLTRRAASGGSPGPGTPRTAPRRDNSRPTGSIRPASPARSDCRSAPGEVSSGQTRSPTRCRTICRPKRSGGDGPGPAVSGPRGSLRGAGGARFRTVSLSKMPKMPTSGRASSASSNVGRASSNGSGCRCNGSGHRRSSGPAGGPAASGALASRAMRSPIVRCSRAYLIPGSKGGRNRPPGRP